MVKRAWKPTDMVRLAPVAEPFTSSLRCPVTPGLSDEEAFCVHALSTATVAELDPCPDCPLDFGPWGTWRSFASGFVHGGRPFYETWAAVFAVVNRL